MKMKNSFKKITLLIIFILVLLGSFSFISKERVYSFDHNLPILDPGEEIVRVDCPHLIPLGMIPRRVLEIQNSIIELYALIEKNYSEMNSLAHELIYLLDRCGSLGGGGPDGRNIDLTISDGNVRCFPNPAECYALFCECDPIDKDCPLAGKCLPPENGFDPPEEDHLMNNPLDICPTEVRRRMGKLFEQTIKLRIEILEAVKTMDILNFKLLSLRGRLEMTRRTLEGNRDPETRELLSCFEADRLGKIDNCDDQWVDDRRYKMRDGLDFCFRPI